MGYARKIQPGSYYLKREVTPRLAPAPLPVEPAPPAPPASPAPPEALVLTTLTFLQGPGTPNAGAVIAPPVEVTAFDQHGDPLPGVPVTITINSGTGTLGGTVTQTTDGSGVATFNDLTIDTQGNFTLESSNNAVFSPVTPSFTVQPPLAPTTRYFISSDETADYSGLVSVGTQRALDPGLVVPVGITDHTIVVDGTIMWYATFMTRVGHPGLTTAPNGHYKLSVWLKYNKMATVTGRTPRFNIDIRIKHLEDPVPAFESAGNFDVLYTSDNTVFSDVDNGVWQRVEFEFDMDWADPLLVTDRLYIYAFATQGASMTAEPWGFTIRTGGGDLAASTYFDMPFTDV